MCNSCGNPFVDENVRFCSACGAQVPGWMGPRTKPSPANTTAKNVPLDPPNLPVKEKDKVAPNENKTKTKLRSWILDHKALSMTLGLLGVFFSLLGIFVSISGAWYFAEWVKGRSSPLPKAVYIRVANTAKEVEAGQPLRLDADLSPRENTPAKFQWEPPDMIAGSGAWVVFTAPNDGRHVPYSVTVTVKTFDGFGNSGPFDQETITVLPKGQTNHKPTLPEDIHLERPEVPAGAPVKLEALAADQDPDDKLYYEWDPGYSSIKVEGQGQRKVKLDIPRDFVRKFATPITIKLRVSDGHVDGFIDSSKILTITPAGKVRILRAGRKPQPTPLPQAQPAGTEKPNSNLKQAAPQATQPSAKPDQAARP